MFVLSPLSGHNLLKNRIYILPVNFPITRYLFTAHYLEQSMYSYNYVLNEWLSSYLEIQLQTTCTI